MSIALDEDGPIEGQCQAHGSYYGDRCDGCAAQEIDDLKAENERLRAALKVTHQTILEVAHAQEVGPWWFTKGEPALYQQVALHIRRGLDAVASCASDTGPKA